MTDTNSAADAARKLIQAHCTIINNADCAIEIIAKESIADFHFLEWRVSKFWECDDSPIGMCVFPALHIKGEPCCRYCGDPEERK